MQKKQAEEILGLIKNGKVYNHRYENGDADDYETIHYSKENKFVVVFGSTPWDCNSKSDYIKKELYANEFIEYLVDSFEYEKIVEHIY